MRHVIIFLFASVIAFSCGDPEEEENEIASENLSKSQEVTVHSKNYRIENASLFEKSCNQFFMSFLLDTNNACVAVSVSSSITDVPDGYSSVVSITGGSSTLTYNENSTDETWTDSAGNKYYCYLYTGGTYAENGEQNFFTSHLILSSKEATNYSELTPASDIHLIGTSKEHCEGMY